MNILELEQKRQTAFLKFWGWILLGIIIFLLAVSIVADFRTTTVPANSTLANVLMFTAIGLFMLSGAAFFKSATVNRPFGQLFKRFCMDKIVKKIVGERGELIWSSSDAFLAQEEELDEDSLGRVLEELRNDIRKISETAEEEAGLLAALEKEEEEFKSKANNHTKSKYNSIVGDCTKKSKLFSLSRGIRHVTYAEKSFVEVDDVFLGKYEGVDLRIAQIRLMAMSEIRTENNSGFEVFRGIVMTLKTKREFAGHTIIGKGRRINEETLNSFNLSKTSFSNTSNVYTNNADEASGILKPALTTFLLSFKKGARMACFDDNVVLIFPSKIIFRLGSIFKNINDDKQYREFEQDFKNILKIIDTLKEIDGLNLT